MTSRSACSWIAGTMLALVAVLGAPTAAVSASPGPALRALHFPASFVPEQITAAAGDVWVLGAPAPSAFVDCSLWKLDPSSMATQSFPLPQCASDITSGNGRVYMLVNSVELPSDTRDYHIEVFDPATDAVQVLPPVDLQNVGSAVAHTELSFGEGSLWLYGYSVGAKSEVVQISPVTGDVENTIDNAPEIGGTFPRWSPTARARGSVAAPVAPRRSNGCRPARDRGRIFPWHRAGDPAPSYGCRRRRVVSGPRSRGTGELWARRR